MVNRKKDIKKAETLANKEKSSQIAGRNFFQFSLIENLVNALIVKKQLEKNEYFMKGNGHSNVLKMVNDSFLMVNDRINYVNEID